MKNSRRDVINLAYQNPRFKFDFLYPDPKTFWAMYLFDHPKYRLQVIRDKLENCCRKELK